MHIYVDADACPVKSEVFRVADRYSLQVTLVANQPMRVPENNRISLQIVDDSLDAADQWIVEQVEPDDIVITADVPLAAQCLKKQAYAIGNTGKRFTDLNIGTTLATRDLMADLRGAGALGGGPPPMTKRDRSRFLQTLDEVIQAIRRSRSSNELRDGL